MIQGASEVSLTVPPTMPLRSTIWGTRLPDNAALDIANQTAWSAEVVRQSKIAKPNLNVWSWTVEPMWVPANQPLVPVTCNSGNSQWNAIAKLGLPIPIGFQPTHDPDAAAAFWQPDWTNPYGSQGRYYEVQALHQDPNTGLWSCNFGGRMTGVNNRASPHYVNWTASGYAWAQYATNPDSTYELANWGTQGSGLPYWPGVLNLRDVQRGFVDHMLLLEVVDAAKGGHVWPAIARGDGGAVSPNPAVVIQEGQRARFLSDAIMPPGLHPLARLIWQGCKDYGCIITDRTAYDLCFRAAPSVGARGYLGSTADYDVLNGFPWQELKLQTVGSDLVPTLVISPTTTPPTSL